MRKIALTLLLLAAAGTAPHAARAAPDGAAAAPPTGAGPAARDEAPVRPMAPALRNSVMLQCRKAFPGESICACVVHQLEVLSPDAEVVTAEALQVAVRRCRRV